MRRQPCAFRRWAGDWPPRGLEYHCCFRSNGDLHVIEVWSSRALLRQSGQWLRPLLEHAGIDLDEVDVFDVDKVVKP
jgi:hypothetical protein